NILLTVVVGSTISSAVIAHERYFDERYIHSQAFIQPILINPGATGFSGLQNLYLNYRNTWSGFAGSPTTATVTYDGNLIDRVGVGLLLMQDNYGALRTNKAQLNLSYGITSTNNELRFGLSTEYINHGLNNVDAKDFQLDPNDALIRARRAGVQFFDISFGIFGLFDKKLTYGIALPSLLSSRISDGSSDPRDLGFIFNVGYKLMDVAPDVSIEPSIFVKKLNNVPTHVDFNLKAGFLEEKLTGGVTYRLGADNRLGFLLGFKLNVIDIFYSYNTSTWQFQDYNRGAHEIAFKMALQNKK
ncbi:MAG TPA: PorP/SprF family type IX secretion system membrane protein, partial [Saprospiraceae bacterium]|nr:PorP/SprF family type IX secretion system membrane protein [Saprospiraceae bacterium]